MLALLVLGTMGAFAWRIQSPDPFGSFTEFYILGKRGIIQGYPTTLRIGQRQSYKVGIINQERRTATYTVRAYLDGFEAGSVGPLVVLDGERWEGLIRVAPVVEGTRQRLEVRLFRDNENEDYHRVHIYVDVHSSPRPGS